jgi:glycosyltransferase involved in cell wall biosynthesis
VVPAYNEEARLGAALESLVASPWLRGQAFEIVVVDDGSSDGTAAIVEEWGRRHANVRLLRNASNRGKGYSVRRGFLESQGEAVLFTDADLSAPIEEAEKLWRALEAGADVAIGSRGVDRERVRVRRAWLRGQLAGLFRLFTWGILGIPFRDTQCGLKLFRRAAAAWLFEQQRSERYAFDAELLFLAHKRGLRIAEVGVNWVHDPRSKIRVLADGGRMLVDLLQIRWRWLRGAYGAPPAGSASQPDE